MNRQTISRFWLSLIASLMLLLGQASSAATAPETILDNLSKQMIDTLKQERETVQKQPERLFNLVENILVPHVDMVNMSRWVLGRYWRTASEAQQERFVEEFKTLLVRFYVAALLDDPNELDKLLAANEKKPLISFIASNTPNDAKQALVRSEVNVPDGPMVPVSFRLYRQNPTDEWKVIDVTVDGISLVTNYRSSFASDIDKDGLEATIENLAKRNQELLEKARNNGQSNETVTN